MLPGLDGLEELYAFGDDLTEVRFVFGVIGCHGCDRWWRRREMAGERVYVRKRRRSGGGGEAAELEGEGSPEPSA